MRGRPPQLQCIVVLCATWCSESFTRKQAGSVGGMRSMNVMIQAGLRPRCSSSTRCACNRLAWSRINRGICQFSSSSVVDEQWS